MDLVGHPTQRPLRAHAPSQPAVLEPMTSTAYVLSQPPVLEPKTLNVVCLRSHFDDEQPASVRAYQMGGKVIQLYQLRAQDLSPYFATSIFRKHCARVREPIANVTILLPGSSGNPLIVLGEDDVKDADPSSQKADADKRWMSRVDLMLRLHEYEEEGNICQFMIVNQKEAMWLGCQERRFVSRALTSVMESYVSGDRVSGMEAMYRYSQAVPLDQPAKNGGYRIR